MDRAGKRLVLIVEDDEAVRASTRLLLEAQGYLVRDFADAESFLQATDGRDADCVLLDHNLPGLSGLDLVAILRSRGIQTPVVIISASGKAILPRAAKEGVHVVLRKPLAADALLTWLEQILATKD